MSKGQMKDSDSKTNHHHASRLPLVLYGLSFSLLGLCVGIFAGLSHSPVIGVILPLLFGLIGGAKGLYLTKVDLTNENDRKRLGTLGLLLSVFLFSVLASSLYGILVRTGSGPSSLIPNTQPAKISKTQITSLADIKTMNADTILELALLRYRLSQLGVRLDEQEKILAMAAKEISPLSDSKQMAAVFGNLFTLINQVGFLWSEQERLDRDLPFQTREIMRFFMVKMSQYKFLEMKLQQQNVPISHIIDLLEKDRDLFSEAIRVRRWSERTPNRFTQWLLDNPDIRNRLWELELAYMKESYRIRGLGWLTGQTIAEAIDKLIQSGGSSEVAKADDDIISRSRRQTGFAP